MPNDKSKPANWKSMTPNERSEWRLWAGTDKTGFVGVTARADGSFVARIYNRMTGKTEHIGSAKTAKAAAELYNMRAIQLYGPGAGANPAGVAKPWISDERKLKTFHQFLREIINFDGEFNEEVRQRIAASREKLISEGQI